MKLSSATVIGCMTTLASAGVILPESAQNQKPAHTTSCYPASTGTNDYKPGPGPGKKVHKVDVGALGQLIFSPNQVEAAVGDVIEFNFLALNHTVTQSEFETPCTNNGRLDSGFQFNPKNETGVFRKSLTVKDTKPMWFYCKQPAPVSHCGRGMVFGVNPAGKMDQFIKNAEKQKGSTPGTAPPTKPTIITRDDYQNDTPTGNFYGTPTSVDYYATPTSVDYYATPTSSDYYATPTDDYYGTPTGDDYYGTPTPTITVTVGLQNGTVLKFDPEFLQDQKKGTVVHFDFRALNHTLTESSFDDPCKKLNGTDIDTNFMNFNKEDIPGAKPFDLILDSDEDKPRWFYCKQANGQANGHCANGMVFAINPKSKEQFDKFVKKAAATLPKIKGRGLELGQMS